MKTLEGGQIRLVLSSATDSKSPDVAVKPLGIKICHEDDDRAMRTIVEHGMDRVKTPSEIDSEFERAMDSAVQAQHISATGKDALIDQFRQECFALSPTMEVELAGGKDEPVLVQILSKEGDEVVFERRLETVKTPAEVETEVRSFLRGTVQAEKIPEGIEEDLVDQFRRAYFLLFHS